MAQNITLMGASYSAVPAVTLPKTGGGTAQFTDVTDTTAAAADVASGKYFTLLPVSEHKAQTAVAHQRMCRYYKAQAERTLLRSQRYSAI